jgi:hypothetical protein
MTSHYGILKGLRICCLTSDYGRMDNLDKSTPMIWGRHLREVEHQETGELQQVYMGTQYSCEGITLFTSSLSYSEPGRWRVATGL